MEDLLRAALAPGVTPREFFFDHLPALHQDRLEDFRRVVEGSLILSLLFEDTGNRFTVELGQDGVEVEEGDMIDFPQATIVGEEGRWEAAKQDVLEAVLALHAHREKLEHRYGDRRLTQDIKDAFEDLRGTIEVTVKGGHAPFDVTVILNDYDPEAGAPSFGVEATKELVMGMARGELEPRAASGQLRLTGKRGFALELAGFLSTHFDL